MFQHGEKARNQTELLRIFDLYSFTCQVLFDDPSLEALSTTKVQRQSFKEGGCAILMKNRIEHQKITANMETKSVILISKCLSRIECFRNLDILMENKAVCLRVLFIIVEITSILFAERTNQGIGHLVSKKLDVKMV